MKEDNKGFWDKWAHWYDKAMLLDRNTYAQIIDRMKTTLTKEMTVLELACGTGLISTQIAGSVKMLEASDFSKEMIQQAKKKPHSSQLHFSVQNAANLPYVPETFDAAIISNALHIMPEPEKVLLEIARVLRPGGILIAPTFTMSDTFFGRLRMWIMELCGFQAFHKWTSGAFLSYLSEHGFTVTKSDIIGKSARLTYAQAVKTEIKPQHSCSA